MVVGYGALATAGGDDRYVGHFYQFHQGFFGVGPGYATACVYERQLGACNDTDGVLQLVGAGHDA